MMGQFPSLSASRSRRRHLVLTHTCLSTTTGSIEEQAFLLQPTLVDDADLLRDDIPRNNEYLASQERGGKHKRLPEPLSAFETVNLDDTPKLESQVISETDGETIKLFQPQGVTAVEDFVQDYASRPPSTPWVSRLRALSRS